MRKNRLNILVAALLFGFSFLCAAGAFCSDEEKDAAAVRGQVRAAIAGLRGPYSSAALRVSPARLPDAADYLLDRPMGFDFSFPLDSFKHSYCGAVPAAGDLTVTRVSDPTISEWIKKVNKKGAMIDGGALLGAVKRRVKDFKVADGKNRYDYAVEISRMAGVEADAGRFTFDLVFAETAGEWLLYDIGIRWNKAVESPRGNIETLGFAPYYLNCKRGE